MTISHRRQTLKKQRHLMLSKIKRITTVISELAQATPAHSDLPAVCYDNRHNKAYYKNHENQFLILANKIKLSLPEQEALINHMFACVYYKELYPDFHERNLKNKHSKKDFMDLFVDKYLDEPSKRVGALLKLGLYTFKIKLDSVCAEQYLIQALNLAQKDPLLRQIAKDVYIPALYDYLSITSDAQGRVSHAITYLTKSINYRKRIKDKYNLIKYQYIKQALLYARMGEFTKALNNLDNALKYKSCYIKGDIVFDMNEIVYWEKTKIFVQKSNYTDAKKTLTKLIGICQEKHKKHNKPAESHPHASILTLLKNYNATVGG